MGQQFPQGSPMFSKILKANPLRRIVFADVLKFDPRQPRDERGRWTREGGGKNLDEQGKVHALFSSQAMRLPKIAHQPFHDPDTLYSASAASLQYLKQWLNQGQGLADQMGYKTMAGSPDDAIKSGEMNQPGGQLYIAKLKDRYGRAATKVAQDYKGDWSKLLDVTRASIAVDNLDQVRQTIDTLTKGGMVLAKRPKNRFENPTNEHYRDTLLNVKFPNGSIGEIQVHLKPMLIAKAEGHPHYEVIRGLLGKYGETSDRSTWSVEDQQAFNKATAASRALYDAAWKKSI
jgi:hypothetical protein